MAITPRTIFNSPAPAVVAALSLLSFTALGTMAYKKASVKKAKCFKRAKQVKVAKKVDKCRTVRANLSQSKSQWSEFDWYTYASCYEQQNNSRRVISITNQALRYHPNSEALFNLKGYHQIVLGQYTKAVKTLELGLRRVGTPSSGTMMNNLAWAGLWVPREMTLDRARKLYQKSLTYSSSTCEVVHTGLWVEFAIAKESEGFTRYEALRNFENLRDRYEPCHNRINNNDWNTVVEVLGASVLIEEVKRGSLGKQMFTAPNTRSTPNAKLMRVGKKIQQRYKGASIDTLCRESMPLSTVHHACIKHVNKTVNILKGKKIRRVIKRTPQRKVTPVTITF